MAADTKWVPGPYSAPTPYGLLGFEIQAQGRSIAVVNRVDSARLSHLHGRMDAKSKRGEPSDTEAADARALEARAAEALATAHLFRASPNLYAALAALVATIDSLGTVETPKMLAAHAALAMAEGR